MTSAKERRHVNIVGHKIRNKPPARYGKLRRSMPYRLTPRPAPIKAQTALESVIAKARAS